jgi:2-amino-4-hydroxy-6-hydroxymethyldihydropteridine diphosphokinase
MAITFLSIGSNIDDRLLYLNRAIQCIHEKIGRVILQSNIYETEAWGYDGSNFLNMVIKAETELDPTEILLAIQAIEAELKREKQPGGYSDRTIDIDILFYNQEVIEAEDLKIPHPQIPNRNFVLDPMVDIAPDFIHPGLNKTIKELATKCTDKSWVKPFSYIK